MAQNLRQLFRQLIESWKQLGLNQRVSLVLGAGVVLAGLLGLTIWSSRPDYALLYGKLDDAEAAKVMAVLDDAGPIEATQSVALNLVPPHPLKRQRIRRPFSTGIKAIDTFVPCGRGQRLGIFAGSGVGKSTLLGMIAGRAESDVNVIALIGERGREVREFLENDLDQVGRKKSVVVVATSNQPALARLRGAFLAMAIAEHFRDAGNNVLLMMDSVIDVLESVSRLVSDLTTPEQQELAGQAREMLAIYRKNQDLINIGAYPAGSNVAIDRAIQLHEPLRQFLRQGIAEGFAAQQSWGRLGKTMVQQATKPVPVTPPPPPKRP